MSAKPLVVVILGATATGKTKLSVELAKQYYGEIVSADSMQIYRGMDIGTAKPDLSERHDIKHYMMDIIDPFQKYSVSDYVKAAKECINEILSKSKLPIVVGGTGLYISSLVDNVNFGEMQRDEQYRRELLAIAGEHGGSLLREMLYKVDPVTAERLHDNDISRLVRALEVYHVTGEPISAWAAKSKEIESPYRFCMMGLRYTNRELLYERINQRVDDMIKKGLPEEVRRLLDSGVPLDSTAMQAIGYKEFIDYFNGDISFDDAVNKIKMESRRYAKRQTTWFKKDERIEWIDIDKYQSYDEIVIESKNILEKYVIK